MKNTYFETMMEISKAYEKVRSEHEKKKDQIIDTYGYDSTELKDWYDEKELIKKQNPYTNPEYIALRSWYYPNQGELDDIILDDFFWNKETTEEFINTLRSAEVETFVVVNNSSALMENIHWFVESGCTFVEPCTIHYEDGFRGDRMGLRFKVS